MNFNENKDLESVVLQDIGTNRTTEVYVRHEVILSGGAYESPHLLLLSGVGPAAELANHNIPVVVDLPGVGKNLRDHLSTRELPL